MGRLADGVLGQQSPRPFGPARKACVGERWQQQQQKQHQQ